jgi:hypothetical protein
MHACVILLVKSMDHRKEVAKVYQRGGSVDVVSQRLLHAVLGVHACMSEGVCACMSAVGVSMSLSASCMPYYL